MFAHTLESPQQNNRSARTGRRRLPLAVIKAIQEEQKHPTLPCLKKGHLSYALQGARSALGISKGTTETLLLLIALVKPDIFENGKRAIVSPSNSFLAFKAGVGIRAIQKRIAQAIQAGLLCPIDSPDMKRSVRRHDKESEQYGFDLSPLVRRYDELENHRKKLDENYKAAIKTRRAISRVRNQCLALIDTLATYPEYNNDISPLIETVQAVVRQRRQDEMDVSVLGELLLQLEAIKRRLIENMSSLQNNVDNFSTSDNSVDNPSSHAVIRSPVGELQFTQQRTTKEKQVSKETTASLKKKKTITGDFPLTPHLACKLAPSFSYYVKNPTWQALLNASPDLAKDLGIAKWSFIKASRKLSRLEALAILIAVAGRYERGNIRSPGAIFTKMTDLALTGELHLDKTFYGLISVTKPSETLTPWQKLYKDNPYDALRQFNLS